MSSSPAPSVSVSVAVLCLSSAQHLTHCLASLHAQRDAPAFDITVVCDPGIPEAEAVCLKFPGVRCVVNYGQQSLLQLASRALRECRGELILVTKDQCTAAPDWVRSMVAAQAANRAVVGGRVEAAAAATSIDWAFYYIDFHRYAGPIGGAVHTLSVCNVSYRRSRLEEIRPIWEDAFVETRINDALAARFGTLWLEPASEVVLHRHLSLRDAVYERYALGRLYGASRLAATSGLGRMALALLSPALPFLLIGRMARVAFRSPKRGAAFVRSFGPLLLMTIGRSWGECLAYATGRPPRTLTVRH